MRSLSRITLAGIIAGAFFFLLWYTHSQCYYQGYEDGIDYAVKQFNKR